MTLFRVTSPLKPQPVQQPGFGSAPLPLLRKGKVITSGSQSLLHPDSANKSKAVKWPRGLFRRCTFHLAFQRGRWIQENVCPFITQASVTFISIRSTRSGRGIFVAGEGGYLSVLPSPAHMIIPSNLFACIKNWHLQASTMFRTVSNKHKLNQ